MNDLTVVFYTANYISGYFMSNVITALMRATKGLPVASVSQKPLAFGHNIVVGDIGRSNRNIYVQALEGAKAADTKYIAMAEDDTFYTPGHFDSLPRSPTFMYNLNKWGLFTWEKYPKFHHKTRPSLSQLVAPRELFIEAIQERFDKYPDPDALDPNDRNYGHLWCEPGRGKGRERRLGLKEYKCELFASPSPSVVVWHEDAIGFAHLGTRKRGGNPAIPSLPYWGDAKEMIKLFRGRNSE